MLYARKINRRINSGIYLGPTQGLSSPKNNRRACLCTNKATYSRECCNGDLIAQGIGSIQGTTTAGPNSTTTTTIQPTSTTTTTAAPTSTTTSTTTAGISIVTSGLIIWNHFTDYNTDSGTIADRSGNNNTALVSGSTMSLSGSLGLAMDGTSNYFTYPNPVNTTPTASYSLQFYGTVNLDGSNRDYFSKGDFDNGWDIVLTTDNRIVYRPFAGGDKTVTGTTTGASNKLITLTMDIAGNAMKLYVNTTLINTNTNASLIEPFNSGSAKFAFGFNTQPDGTYFKGSFKDITLYNRVLTQGEITTNYNYLSTL